MLERRSAKDDNTEKFTLLTHHLAAWENLINTYLKSFKGVKPWELPEDHTSLLHKFAKDFSYRELDLDLTLLNYFERCHEASPDDETVLQRVRYFRDLIGADEGDFKKVRQRREKVYIKFLKLVQKNGRGTSIVLITEGQDDFCRTCAVGKHCEVSEGKDLIYKDSLMNFIAKKRVRSSSLKVDETGLSITAELLFDPNFFTMLYKDVESRGLREWV